MAGLSVRLPEELGRERTSESNGRRDLHVGRRAGEDAAEPVILRWFGTWARGTDDESSLR